MIMNGKTKPVPSIERKFPTRNSRVLEESRGLISSLLCWGRSFHGVGKKRVEPCDPRQHHRPDSECRFRQAFPRRMSSWRASFEVELPSFDAPGLGGDCISPN